MSERRLLVLVLALLLPLSAAQAEATKIRLTLDWKLQGTHAWYYWAQKKGYFAAENLDVSIDQGEGSAATITRIMSGAYDAGFGDENAIIQTAAQKPGESPVMVYMLYSKAPFALASQATSYMNFVAMKLDPDKNLRCIYYADSGLELYLLLDWAAIDDDRLTAMSTRSTSC
jgi:NitT/TauT family transport system substrate-binding protein